MSVKKAFLGAVFGFLFCWGTVTCCAQDTAQTQTTNENKKVVPKFGSYHLEFAISELEGGKRINTRGYSMNVNRGKREDIRIGSRVPVETKPGELTYLDVGTTISCVVFENEDGLGLDAFADVSSFATHSSPPLLRQFHISGSTLATVGKPIIIGSVDDPDSNHQFQLEVTMTKLKESSEK